MAMRVLITGANRGLGLELPRQLLEAGEEVVATCRAPERAEALRGLASKHARGSRTMDRSAPSDLYRAKTQPRVRLRRP